MKTRAMHLILLSLTILLAASPVAAQETAEDSPVDGLLGLSINLEFKNFFLWQNDSDFDRTDPLYDENGQSVGYFATALTPTMAWQPIDEVLLRYKVQIGENLWSRNDVLERDPTAEDIPTLQHKEIWGAVTLPYDFYVGAGYSSFEDSTNLFLRRELGVFNLTYSPSDEWMLTASCGQLPDSVYEGTTVETPSTELGQNNFENDALIYALQAQANWLSTDFGILDFGVIGLNDRSEIGREKNLWNIGANYMRDWSSLLLTSIDLAVQFGKTANGGINNEDLQHVAFAWQLGVSVIPSPVRLDLNALFLSGDSDRNDLQDSSFMYSGVSDSATVMLSENELQDQYDNLDERAAWQKSGLLLVDLRAGITLWDQLEIFAVGGYARASDEENLDEDLTVAAEADLGVVWTLYENHVDFTVLGGGLWPGKSGGILKNAVDLTAVDPIYYTQALMRLNF